MSNPSPGRSSDVTSLGRLTVADVIRPPVTTVENAAHLAGAALLMKRARDSALVVISDRETRRPVVLLCDGDIAQAVADGRNPEENRISDLHLPEPVAVGPGETVEEAAKRMLSRGLQYLPVVDDGRLLGLVDLTLVCRSLLGRPAA